MSSVDELHTESRQYETMVSLNTELTRLVDGAPEGTNARAAKARKMSRLLIVAALGLAVTGCSQSAQPLSLGLNDGPEDSPSLTRARGGSLGGEPAVLSEERRRTPTGSTRLASLNDKAPHGSYEKAPHGALADRDFSHTLLNAEVARDRINAYRKQKGLKPLQLNASLTAAAKAHSRDLAKWDRISHFGSDGSNPWDRVKRAGYNAKLAAENVGTGQVDFDEVLKGWKESPGHNKNLLLSDAVHMGIALVHEPKSEFKTFWTLVIGASL
ncbi:MAG: CAP domain-containing protein [Hyphomicrobiaceae bacterium]